MENNSRLLIYNIWTNSLEEYLLDDMANTYDANLDKSNHQENNEIKVTLGRRYDQDIVLCLSTISRTHGEFLRFEDGWYYQDNFGKNGTILNGTHLNSGNAAKPIRLNNGDIFNFGADETKSNPYPCYRSMWGMYSNRECDAISKWRTYDFENFSIDDVYSFIDGDKELIWPTELTKNSIYMFETGSAIYTGDKLLVSGDVRIKL